MEREEALRTLSELSGQDLRPLAEEHAVTVWTAEGNLNKGWFGHTVESILGIPLNSSRNPNGGSWELKTVPLKRLRRGGLGVKETMAITMINPAEVSNTPFERSHLLAKLQSIVILARIYEGPGEVSSTVHSVGTFDLDEPAVYEVVESDYNLVRRTIRTHGVDALTGRMGVLVQPRTKGAGHGSTSRAFYARAGFVKQILGI